MPGAKLRETLLKSVPPDRESLYRGLLYLADAVTWLGLTTEPALQFISDTSQVSAVHCAKSVPQVLLDKGPDWYVGRSKPICLYERLVEGSLDGGGLTFARAGAEKP